MSEQLSIGTVDVPVYKDTDEFEAFYKRYPRKVGKPAAKRAWLSARRRASFEEIMGGLAACRFSPDPKFTPHPSTWLNQDRFLDIEPDMTVDSYGLNTWLSSLPSAGDGSLSATAYDVDELLAIMVATGQPATWRGSLDVLNEWMRDGYNPKSCARVIAEAVAEFGTRSKLWAFDKRVRARAYQIDSIY